MPVPADISITGERQGLIPAGNVTKASVGNIYQEGP
jgi:type VI secretion system secreted protein Hcp